MTITIRTTGLEDFLHNGEAYVKCLVLGAPSAGKTRSASFWPKPIFADCEKGRMSIADRNVPYVEVLKTRDMDQLLKLLQEECRKPAHERKYQTLVIDTVDAYQRIVIQERLDAEGKESLGGWGDYDYLDAKMTQFVSRLQQLPMNIVVNVHVKDRTQKTGDDELSVSGPKLKGDFKDQIAAEFDLVGFMGTYFEAEGGERVLKRGIQWHPDPMKPILKDRSGQLPKWTPVVFTDDDYNTLFTTLIGHLDTLSASETLEEVGVAEAEPVPPMKGGPVQGAPIVPATRARKAPAKATSVPPAPRPTPGGADLAPPQAAPEEAAEAPQEPEDGAAVTSDPTPEEAVETVTEALGGEVISSEDAADATPTGEPEAPAQEEPAEVQVPEAVSPNGRPYCGTSTNEGEEGQPGSAPGCGGEVDPNANTAQIGMFKYRTYLCPACFTVAKQQ